MGHSLILGMTESGKTTLAKKLCHNYKARGIKTIVLDPLCDPEWLADFQTSDPEEFLKMFWDSRSCAVFIDESGDVVGKYDTAMQKTATKGRHWGHNVHYISQRGAQINRTVRDQCSNLFLFKSGMNDRKIHAEEWDSEQLKEQLPLGTCFNVGRNGQPQKIKIF